MRLRAPRSVLPTALDSGRPGEEYVLGGDNRSLNTFFDLLAELSGLRQPVRHLPFWACKTVGAVELARAASAAAAADAEAAADSAE